MKKRILRRIDKLGRVVLPAEYRKYVGIDRNTVLSISYENDTIVIERFMQTCKICRSEKTLDPEFHICEECIREIKDMR